MLFGTCNMRQIAENPLRDTLYNVCSIITIVGAKCVSKSLAASRRPVHDGRVYCVITWQFYETVVCMVLYVYCLCVCVYCAGRNDLLFLDEDTMNIGEANLANIRLLSL